MSEAENKAAEPESERDDGLAKAIEAYRKLAEDQELYRLGKICHGRAGKGHGRAAR